MQIGNGNADVKLFFSIAFHPGFHGMLTSHSAHILLKLTVFMELTTVLPSLDTFNISMVLTVLLVIGVPRVRTNLAT